MTPNMSYSFYYGNYVKKKKFYVCNFSVIFKSMMAQEQKSKMK